MSSVERFRVLVFGSVVAVIYFAAAMAALRWTVAKLRRGKSGQPDDADGQDDGVSPSRWARVGRWANRIAVVLAGVGILLAGYAYFVEPTWLDVSEVKLASDKLPGGQRPVRIVHISDLHCDPTVRLEDDLPGVIAELNPDVICFTGDAVNTVGGDYPPEALANFRTLMGKLSEIAPVYVVTGNWDVRTAPLYGELKVHVLDGQAVQVIQADGPNFWLVGASAGSLSTATLDGLMDGIPADEYAVLLYHYPAGVLAVDDAARPPELMLAGHVHGGQVALPGYGALVTLSATGKQYEAGLYRRGKTHLYVSRGIGMEGGAAPRVRLFARPEVTLIEIAATGPPEEPIEP